MVEWNADRIITSWNATAAALFSFFEDEAIGVSLDYLLAQRQVVDLNLEGDANYERTSILREHVNVEGRRLCRWYITPFVMKGKCVGALATIVDVTHQTAISNEELRSQLQSRTQVLKHTTERLQKAMNDRDRSINESEKRLRKLAANVPGIIYQFCLSADLAPSFTFISHSSQTIFGIPHTDIQADASVLIELIHPEDLDSFNRTVAHSAQTLCEWHWQGRFVLPSDRTVWIQATSRPERRADNSVVWDGLLMDISHTKQAEADLLRSEVELKTQAEQLKTALRRLKRTQSKLIQSEKMSSLGQLVAGIAHEINNPVNFVHGNLSHVQSYIQDIMRVIRCYQAHYPTPIPTIQELSDELDLDYIVQDLPKLISSMTSGTERIRQIVLSLRNFSRLDESELKTADIHEGLESTLMILGSRLAATKNRREIEVIKAYENIPAVECYVSQLNQVFLSILTNAIDAIDEAGKSDRTYQILLQTFQTAEFVVVRITNNGLPISKADRKRLFDPFFTTKPVGKGTGMGLAISYQTIVDLHQGILDCSQSEDRKTIFTLKIPLEVSKEATTTALNVCSEHRES